MSAGNSNVMFSSSSSSSSSSSAATKVGDLVKKIDETKIKSCVVGISTLKFHWLTKDIAHTALFISDVKRAKLVNKVNNPDKTEGILIEYGNYPPDDPKSKEKEENFIKNGDVIYRYGEKGGLRYYTNTFGEFKDKFCDVGYIILSVEKNELKTFSYFIDKLAPKSEEIWIKSKYSATAIFFGKPLNCQTFVSHTIDIIKPKYELLYVTKGKNSTNVSDDNRESIIPNAVMTTLKKYEDE